MGITASEVKELREKTGAGMMDCKKVLTEANGDMEKAIELLRERVWRLPSRNPAASQRKALLIPIFIWAEKSAFCWK